MKRILIAVVLMIVMGLIMLYRPVKNQSMYSLNYASMSSVGFAYTKDRTADKFYKAVKETSEGEVIQKEDENSTVNMPNVPEGSNATIENVIAFAEAQLGKPYVYGATGPDSFDCSGLTQAAYASVGIDITRTTYTQVTVGKAIDATDPSQWKRGDLIFPHAGHVVIYLGGDEVLHAPQTGDVVKKSPNLYWMSYRGGTYAVRRYVE